MVFARCAGWTAALMLAFSNGAAAQAPGPGAKPPEFPPIEKITEGYEKVNSSAADNPATIFTLWRRAKDGSLLAQLPRDYASKKYFVALTLASGSPFAGLQSGDMYVFWKRVDNRMLLVEPNLDIRSTGDAESKSSVQRLFTDKVLLDVPIVTVLPDQSPVVDLKNVFMDNISKFFRMANGSNPRLASLKKLKAYPENVEI